MQYYSAADLTPAQGVRITGKFIKSCFPNDLLFPSLIVSMITKTFLNIFNMLAFSMKY